MATDATAARRALEGLIETWRAVANSKLGPPRDSLDIAYWNGRSTGLRSCADELEAALAALPPAPDYRPAWEEIQQVRDEAEKLLANEPKVYLGWNWVHALVDALRAQQLPRAVPPAEPAPALEIEWKTIYRVREQLSERPDGLSHDAVAVINALASALPPAEPAPPAPVPEPACPDCGEPMVCPKGRAEELEGLQQMNDDLIDARDKAATIYLTTGRSRENRNGVA